MNVCVYKSNELTDDQWDLIADGFSQAFDRIIAGTQLKEKAYSNTFGFSYHALAIDENGSLAGYNTITPFLYNNGIKVGISGGSFVLKQFRKDIFIFADMITALKDFCKSDGVDILAGVPNNNSFNYMIKINNFKLISDLNYYVLPIRISNILKKENIVFLNIFSWSFAWLLIFINFVLSVFLNTKEKKVKIELLSSPDFNAKRFRSDIYSKECVGEYFFSYRIVNENNTNTAYLMDFRENGIHTYRALFKAIYKILRKEKVDIIMYVGTLRLSQLLLFRVPKKFEPQRLPLTFFLLNEKYVDQLNIISDKKNWNFGLVNFDVR